MFEEATARVHEDFYTLSDEVFGWDEDYGALRDAGVEAIRAHPGAYAAGVLDTVWQQLSEPYYRGGGRPRAEPRAATARRAPGAERGPADPRRAEPLDPPARQRDPAGVDVADDFRFVFDRPADRPRFDELVRRRDELLGALPDRERERDARALAEPAVALVPAADPLARARPGRAGGAAARARGGRSLALAGGALLVVS